MNNLESKYKVLYEGRMIGILRWHEFDKLWEVLRDAAKTSRWYLYDSEQTLPKSPLEPVQLLQVLENIDTLLRREHKEDYCGLVYTNNIEQPTLIKVFHPKGLGASCSVPGAAKKHPRWVLSQIKPEPVFDNEPEAPKHWLSALNFLRQK